MKNSLLFCLMLLSIKLLVKGEFKIKSKYSSAILLDLCMLQPEKGSCDKELPRYYFNSVLKKCTYFTYSGCDGNPNNFPTNIDCLEKCPGKFIPTRKPLHCFDDPEKGRCDAYILSYYYDWKTDSCELFVYTGCDGNNNRFTSIDKCINECRTFEFSLQMKS